MADDVEMRLEIVDRYLNTYFKGDELNHLDKEIGLDNLVLVSFRFGVGNDRFPLRVLVDTGKVADEDIVKVAKQRAHQILMKSLHAVEHWKA